MPTDLSGPALAAAVAEVMGWEDSYNGKAWYDPVADCLYRKAFWCPDTDWNQTAQVIAWLDKKGWVVQTESRLSDGWAAIVDPGSRDQVLTTEAPTVPIAVCRLVVQLKERGLL